MAGISQEFSNCMPCSKNYLADSYLDLLMGQIVHRSELAEIFGSTDLCKGLVNDLDVPALSELDRQLVGEGSHRHLVSSLKFDNCQGAMVNFLDGYHANLVIIEKLPDGVFADPFELQHLVEKKALSNRSTVEIHFDLSLSTSKNCNLVIDLPLHARYPPLDPSGYARVDLGSTYFFLCYHKREEHCNSCLWVLQNLEAPLVEKSTWHITCRDKEHTGFVSIITFLSALVSSMSIILAASFSSCKG